MQIRILFHTASLCAHTLPYVNFTCIFIWLRSIMDLTKTCSTFCIVRKLFLLHAILHFIKLRVSNPCKIWYILIFKASRVFKNICTLSFLFLLPTNFFFCQSADVCVILIHLIYLYGKVEKICYYYFSI